MTPHGGRTRDSCFSIEDNSGVGCNHQSARFKSCGRVSQAKRRGFKRVMQVRLCVELRSEQHEPFTYLEGKMRKSRGHSTNGHGLAKSQCGYASIWQALMHAQATLKA